MTDSIRRNDWKDLLRDHRLPVAPLQDDPRIAGVGVEAADLDQDGEIGGERELDALFDRLDRVDGRDGRVLVERRGVGGVASPMLAAVAELGGVPDLAARTANVENRDAIVVVGMSPSALAEAEALRRRAPTLLITDGAAPGDAVFVAGRALELSTPSAVRSFVASLGLPRSVARAVGDCIARSEPGARRELAELARAWAAAERGGRIPPRLMLSGHGDHQTFFGDDGDRLDDARVVELALAMPHAAAQIECLHLAACQHGYEPRMAPFIEAFPNLQSAWGYAGFSPSGAPALAHQALWERGTREGAREALDRGDARGTRRGEAVCVWTRGRGFEGPRREELSVLRTRIVAGNATFAQYWSGALRADPALDAFLGQRYATLQAMTQHPDFREQSPEFRAVYERARDATFRLRFVETSLPARFDRHFGAEVTRGLRTLGLGSIRFEGLGRAETLRRVAEAEARFVAAGRPAAAARALELLTHCVRDLEARYIPAEWL